ncbi:hypothetical protein GGF46_002728 [Coemansia sp. RSA 552]|nr:hypothetical protein GGF46_002728 [Coemansia sp. RSA 552]
MWQLPVDARLRLPVAVALTAWMGLLAVLGFTRLIALPLSNKAQHFVGFGVMAALVFFSFQPGIPRRKAWAVTGGLMGVSCFFSEVVQWILTTRQFQWGDIVANFLGALTFLFAAWMVDTWIIQPRAGGSQDGAANYWALHPGDEGRESADFEVADDLDVELDEILAEPGR